MGKFFIFLISPDNFSNRSFVIFKLELTISWRTSSCARSYSFTIFLIMWASAVSSSSFESAVEKLLEVWVCSCCNCFFALIIKVIREQRKFSLSVYQKQHFSGVYTHFDSFLRNTYKIGMTYSLVNRRFRICSNWSNWF